MKKNIAIGVLAASLIGCATNMPIHNDLVGKNVQGILENTVKINESTEEDIRLLFGEPQIVSRFETSSVESELLKLPLLNQLTTSVKSNVAPYTTWTYIQPVNENGVKTKRAIQILGWDVYYKDIRIINVFFNEKGKVLGYNITAHAIQ